MSKTTQVKILLCLLALSPFAYWLSLHLNQDAWWDEVLSLKKYALVNIKTTLTSYPDPNNHIFFNLLNNGYSYLLGTGGLYEALDQLFFYRTLQALFALACMAYTYLLGKQLTNPIYAIFGVLLLTCTLPFLNFSLQLRGYNLSSLFLLSVMYHGWKYLDTYKYTHLIALGTAVFLLLYTMPSNIYPLIVLLILLCREWYVGQKKEALKNKRNSKRYFIWFLAILAFSFLMVYLAYLPVLENVLNNRFVAKEPSTKTFVLDTLLPQVFIYFVSNRWGLLLFVLIGFIVNKRKKNWQSLSFRAKGLVYVLFGTFLLAFLHGKAPFQRTFVCLAPIFALSLNVLIYKIAVLTEIKKIKKNTIILILSAYSLGTCLYEIEQNDKKLIENLTLEKREQNIYRNYYLSSEFKPNNVARKISQIKKTKTPVIMLDEIDRVSLLYYLLKYDIESYGVVKVQQGNQKINGKNFNHAAMVQKTNGKDKEVNYLNIPFNLPLNNGIKEYFLILSMYQQTHPGENLFILTAYPQRLENNRKLLKDYSFSKHSEQCYLSIFEGSKT